MIRFNEAKKAGKRSASLLLLPRATDALSSSSCRKQKLSVWDPPPRSQGPCTYCGNIGHGRNPTIRVRRTEYTAFGTKCNHCEREHYSEKMCRNKDSIRSTRSTEPKNVIFDTI